MSNKVKGGISLVLLSLCINPISVSALNCQSISKQYAIDLDSFKYPISFDTIQDSPPTQNVFKVELDLCKSLKQDTSLPAEESCPQGTRICLKKINKHKGQSDRLLQVIPIAGSFKDDGDGKSDFNHKADSGKFTIEYHGSIYNKIQQQAEIDLTCDESISDQDSVPIFDSYDELKGVLNLSWKHKNFCSKGKGSSGGDGNDGKTPSDGDKDKDEGSKSGWGFFSWFFFLIFALFAIYLFTGIYQNHKAGSRGIELLPHRHFWSEVPAMARDLFGNGIRLGRGGSGRGDYEAL